MFLLDIFSFSVIIYLVIKIGGNMKKRIISAVVMIIILVPLLIIGKLPFAVLALILGLGSVYELLKLKPKLPMLTKIITFILTGILIIYAYFNKSIFNILTSFDLRILLLVPLILLILLVFINDQKKYNYQDAFYLIGVTIFLGIAFGNLIKIRELGLYIFLYLLSISVMTDTFALFTGMMFGKHKLAPLISPNKTIEGAIGGSLFGTVAGSLIYIFLIKDYQNIFLLILLTLFLSIIGQLGDLVKSSIKRNAGIKDFSNLIPGHGGILDRFDSIIFISLTYIVISSLF